MRVCVCTSQHVPVYVCQHVRVFSFARVCQCVHECLSLCQRILYVCVCLYACPRVRMCLCVCVSTYVSGQDVRVFVHVYVSV